MYAAKFFCSSKLTIDIHQQRPAAGSYNLYFPPSFKYIFSLLLLSFFASLFKMQNVLLRRGHSDWSASSGQPSYYFLWPAASGRARTECDIVLISLC